MKISNLIISLGIAAIVASNLQAQTEAPKLFRVHKGGKVGFIDNTGKVVIPTTLPEDTGVFSEGLAPVKTAPGVWKYIDETGKTKLSLKFGYIDVFGFSEGLALVHNTEDKFGYIDKMGHEVIKPEYQLAFDFLGGYASVKKEDQKPVFLDKNGKVTFPEYIPTMRPFSEGLAFVSLKSDKRFPPLGGYIDQNGKLVIPCEYAFSANPCTEGVVMVVRDGVRMAWNTKGDLIFKGGFNQLLPFSEGLAQAKIGNLWGYVDHQGKIAIAPNYENCAGFSEGLAGVKLNGKWGFIDKTGKIVIEPNFVVPASWEKNRIRIPQFHGGLAQMPEGTKAGYIDKTGKWIWPASE